jgi:hypothetical protein
VAASVITDLDTNRSCPPAVPSAYPSKLGGRPSKLTRELAHKVYEYLRSGASFTATYRALGISKEVFRRWRRRCDDERSGHVHGLACTHLIERMERSGGQLMGTGEFVPFVGLVEQALGEHEARLALLITQAAEKDWRAALEMLRRRYPENWNAEPKHETTAPEVGPVALADARERLMARVQQVRDRARHRDDGREALEILDKKVGAS